VGSPAGVPVVRLRGASGDPGSPAAGAAGGVVAVGGGVADVSGRRWTVGDRPAAVEPVAVGVVVVVGVVVTGVVRAGADGVEGEVIAGGVGGAALGGVAGLLGEPDAGARCTVVLVGGPAGVPVLWLPGDPVSAAAGAGGAAGGVVAVGCGVAEVSGRRWTVGGRPEPVEVGVAWVGVAGVAGDWLDGVEGEVLVAGGVVLGAVAGALGEPGAGAAGARCTLVVLGGPAGVPVARLRGASGDPDSSAAGAGGAAGGVVAVGGGVAEVSGLLCTAGAEAALAAEPADAVPVVEEAPPPEEGVGDAVPPGRRAASPDAGARCTEEAAGAPPWPGVEGLCPGRPGAAADVGESAACGGVTGTAGGTGPLAGRGPSAACGERDVDRT
jgi:hypothetical protein